MSNPMESSNPTFCMTDRLYCEWHDKFWGFRSICTTTWWWRKTNYIWTRSGPNIPAAAIGAIGRGAYWFWVLRKWKPRLMVITGAHVISHWCCSCEPCGPLGLPWNMIRRVGQGWYYTDVEVVSLVGLWAFHQIWSKEWGQWLLESLIILGIIWVMSRDSWFLTHDSWFLTHDSWFLTHDSWFLTHDSWFLTHDSWFTQWADSCTHWWNCKPNFQLSYGAISVFNSLAEEED